LLRAAEAPTDERVACLRQAFATASMQGSRSLELRALTALYQELSDPDERTRTLEKLRELLAGFSEGHGSKPLLEAQALLDEAAH